MMQSVLRRFTPTRVAFGSAVAAGGLAYAGAPASQCDGAGNGAYWDKIVQPPAPRKVGPASLKLMYFDGRGLMELPRQLLATAGKFPGEDYEDFRYPIGMKDGKFSVEEFTAAQKSGQCG